MGSARYWRLNSIAALKMMQREESDAQSPEDFEIIKSNRDALSTLQAAENAVQVRYGRIIGRQDRMIAEADNLTRSPQMAKNVNTAIHSAIGLEGLETLKTIAKNSEVDAIREHELE